MLEGFSSRFCWTSSGQGRTRHVWACPQAWVSRSTGCSERPSCLPVSCLMKERRAACCGVSVPHFFFPLGKRSLRDVLVWAWWGGMGLGYAAGPRPVLQPFNPVPLTSYMAGTVGLRTCSGRQSTDTQAAVTAHAPHRQPCGSSSSGSACVEPS